MTFLRIPSYTPLLLIGASVKLPHILSLEFKRIGNAEKGNVDELAHFQANPSPPASITSSRHKTSSARGKILTFGKAGKRRTLVLWSIKSAGGWETNFTIALVDFTFSRTNTLYAHSPLTQHLHSLFKMFSFKSVSAFLALAFAATASAAIIPSVPAVGAIASTGKGLLPRVDLPLVGGVLPTVESVVPVGDVLRRDTIVTKKSMAVIFTETTTKVTPICGEFCKCHKLRGLIQSDLRIPDYVNKQNATVDALTPLVSQLRTILGDALNDILSLSGEANTVILAPVEGAVLVTVAELAQLIAGLLTVSLLKLQDISLD